MPQTFPHENLLTHETSPYLLQHADNPVHWRAWNDAALEEARERNVPILLSVGYAACHWCHVMAHESFEDPETADLMNDLFVNIKVDREERPDLDTIYQSALSLLGEQGGWPLTMFLTPDGKPFWGGTYFPPHSKFGRPGFSDVLKAISDTYHSAPEKVATNTTALLYGLRQISTATAAPAIDETFAKSVNERLLAAMDPVHGGLGDAPKFPQPCLLHQLWAHYRRHGSKSHRSAVLRALRHMCDGGIYDHLGGGFARYTVDRAWLVPHFEKMLYDNAQLVDLLTLAYQDSGDPLFRTRTEETIAWMIDDMQTVDGGFASARDADSEGEEGKFYVWTASEIDRILEPADAILFKEVYDVSPSGNWEGKSILNRLSLDRTLNQEEEERIARCREILLEHRATREYPLKDDKILTDWNGLAIAALAHAGCVFEQPDWLTKAKEAYSFIKKALRTEDDRLCHTYRNGQARYDATLDDYAFMISAALTLHEATGDTRYIDHATQWVAVLNRYYLDETDGAYFFTASDNDNLIARTKSGADSVVPNGNGSLLVSLAKLSWITGTRDYQDQAEAIAIAFSGDIQKTIFPYSSLIDGTLFLQNGVQIIIIGRPEDERRNILVNCVHSVPLSERLMLVLSDTKDLPREHPAHGKSEIKGKPTAYICQGQTCSLPITDRNSFLEALQSL